MFLEDVVTVWRVSVNTNKRTFPPLLRFGVKVSALWVRPARGGGGLCQGTDGGDPAGGQRGHGGSGTRGLGFFCPSGKAKLPPQHMAGGGWKEASCCSGAELSRARFWLQLPCFFGFILDSTGGKTSLFSAQPASPCSLNSRLQASLTFSPHVNGHIYRPFPASIIGIKSP